MVLMKNQCMNMYQRKFEFGISNDTKNYKRILTKFITQKWWYLLQYLCVCIMLFLHGHLIFDNTLSCRNWCCTLCNTLTRYWDLWTFQELQSELIQLYALSKIGAHYFRMSNSCKPLPLFLKNQLLRHMLKGYFLNIKIVRSINFNPTNLL
jgi:hypothetical protein